MHQVKIGVVEDEMVIADTICLTLRKLGYQVGVPAANYTQAVKMVEEEKPDLLLIDINLGGGKDGIDLAGHIRSNYTMPIIFLTANSDAGTVDRAKKVRPNAYLVKPFNKNELYAAIEIAISNFTNADSPAGLMEFIMVKDGYDYIKVLLNDILFMQSDQNYIVLGLKNQKKIMIRSTLGEMLERLPKERFKKINRGTIINLLHVSVIQTDKVIINSTGLPINKTIREELIAALRTN